METRARLPDHPAPAAATDVVDLLIEQHRRLETLLKALVDSGKTAERPMLLGCAGDELAVHLSAEEKVFYPAVHALRTEDILLESLEEHLSLKRLLADLLQLPATDETFTAKCKVLDEQARHHHQEEEEHLFPQVRSLFDAALRQRLATEVRAHQDALLRASGAPRDGVMSQTDAAVPLASPVAPEIDDPALQGEGNVTAARRHRESLKEFIDSGQVEQAARDAEPATAGQARELQEAEEAGLSHARK